MGGRGLGQGTGRGTAGTDGDWAGAWTAAFLAWAGEDPALDAEATSDWGVAPLRACGGVLEAIAVRLDRSRQRRRITLRVGGLPQYAIEDGLRALGVGAQDLQGPRGPELRGRLAAEIARALPGRGIGPAAFTASCDCGKAPPCVHVRAAALAFGDCIRKDPAELLTLLAPARPEPGSGPPRPTPAPAGDGPPAAQGLARDFWLGPHLADDGRWLAGEPPLPGMPADGWQSAGPRVDLPARISPPGAWVADGARIVAAMRALCAALPSLHDGRDIEADIAAVGFGVRRAEPPARPKPAGGHPAPRPDATARRGAPSPKPRGGRNQRRQGPPPRGARTR